VKAISINSSSNSRKSFKSSKKLVHIEENLKGIEATLSQVRGLIDQKFAAT